MSVRMFFPILFASCLLLGCAAEEDPSALVNEADELLVNGGIEVAEKREIAVRNYDRAIRIICGEGGESCQGSGSAANPGTEAYNLSHAYFGLGMARIFNLVERIEQLYSGDLLGQAILADDEEDGDGDIDLDEACASQANMDFLVPLLSSIINTSLLPIIDNLKHVTDYPDFSITYEKGFLDLSFLGDEGKIGFFVGASPRDDVDDPGVFGVPEVHAMLGALRVVTAGAQVIFSYNDLTQALLTFGPMFDLDRNASPYEFARFLNTHPCESNPLLDPEFGVLGRQGHHSLQQAREQLTAMFAEQDVGFRSIAEDPRTDALLNYRGDGHPWADNLLDRVRIGGQTRELQSVGALLSATVSPQAAAQVFERLGQSLENHVVFDPIVYIREEEQSDLRDLLAVIDFEEFGIPAMRLGNIFDNPISDLKAIVPLTYTESEPYGAGGSLGVPGDEREDMLDREKPPGTSERTNLEYHDKNNDGNWNQRGDFIIQTERESFRDRDNNYDPPSENPGFRGILGTFWDLNGDGRPDPVYEDQQLDAVTDATRPWASIQSVIAVTDSTAPAGFALAVTDVSPVHYRDPAFYREGVCLLGDLDAEACAGLHVGEVLGHMWPSRIPEPYPAPHEITGRTDPASGSMNRIYMFFPNPSLNGVLLNPRGERGDQYRDLENHELNTFLNNLFYGDLISRLNQ